MNPSRPSSRQARVWPFLLVGCLAASGLATAVVGAQRNTVHPQPRAEELPGPAMATANSNRRVPQPEGTLPNVPAGFSVASYARGAPRAADDGVHTQRQSVRELAVNKNQISS